MLKDFRIGNPHALDYCAPPAPPSKVLYTPPRVRPDAVQQALAAAGDHFVTHRAARPVEAGQAVVVTDAGVVPALDFSVKPLPSGDFEVVREAPREFRVGDRVVAIDGCDPWYSCGDRGVVDLVDEQDYTIRVDFAWPNNSCTVSDGWSWWFSAKNLRHEGAAL